MNTALSDGIGLSNVNERLSVIYGAGYRVRISSVSGLGTIIRLEIPDMISAERITA
jgi:sensor histidine kinase YesM